jgi:hypothetical protein
MLSATHVATYRMTRPRTLIYKYSFITGSYFITRAFYVFHSQKYTPKKNLNSNILYSTMFYCLNREF